MTIDEEIAWYREDLERAALNYARVQMQNFYIEKDGTMKRVDRENVQDMADYFNKVVLTDALDLLRVMAARPLPERTP